MALLDRGRQSCVVTPRVKTLDDTNTAVWSDGTPVTVSHGMLQFDSSTVEDSTRGTQVVNLWKWISRGPWPGGPHSTVTCEGRQFKQDGSAVPYRSGENTTHITVTLREIITEAM